MKDLNDAYLAEVQRLEDEWRNSMGAINGMLESTLEQAVHTRIKLHDFKLIAPDEPWRKVYFITTSREYQSTLEVGDYHDPAYNGDDDTEAADDLDCLEEVSTDELTIEQMLYLLRELKNPASWCYVDKDDNEITAQ